MVNLSECVMNSRARMENVFQLDGIITRACVTNPTQEDTARVRSLISVNQIRAITVIVHPFPMGPRATVTLALLVSFVIKELIIVPKRLAYMATVSVLMTTSGVTVSLGLRDVIATSLSIIAQQQIVMVDIV